MARSNSRADTGETRWLSVSSLPDDSPKSVTFPGSPPKATMSVRRKPRASEDDNCNECTHAYSTSRTPLGGFGGKWSIFVYASDGCSTSGTRPRSQSDVKLVLNRSPSEELPLQLRLATRPTEFYGPVGLAQGTILRTSPIPADVPWLETYGAPSGPIATDVGASSGPVATVVRPPCGSTLISAPGWLRTGNSPTACSNT